MDKPFQTYDDTSDAATCAPRLAALRAELKQRGLDGFVIPHSDQHMGEYLPPRDFLPLAAWLALAGAACGLAYAGVTALLGLPELGAARARFARILRRTR